MSPKRGRGWPILEKPLILPAELGDFL